MQFSLFNQKAAASKCQAREAPRRGINRAAFVKVLNDTGATLSRPRVIVAELMADTWPLLRVWEQGRDFLGFFGDDRIQIPKLPCRASNLKRPGRTACVNVFGCRPMPNLSAGATGRCSKTSGEGTRGVQGTGALSAYGDFSSLGVKAQRLFGACGCDEART
jgi:hypothetical protein